MSENTKQTSKKDLLETLLWKRVPNCKTIHSIEQLTGGASRLMYKAHLQAAGKDVVMVLRMSAGTTDGLLDQLSLPKEVKVINAVSNAGVKVPKVLFEFEEEDGVGAGYAMEFLEGEALGGRIARSKKFVEARKKLTTQTAIALAKIHQVDVEALSLKEHLPTLTPQFVVSEMYKAYQNSNIDVPLLAYTYDWLVHNLPATKKTVLTHGDFRNGNLLVHPTEGLRGVLDWEFGGLGDPMRDLAYFCLEPWRYGVGHLEAGGFGTKEAFIKVYEAETGTPIDQASFHWWQVYACFWWSIACVLMSVSYRTDEGKLGDRISIGRRHTEGLIDLVNLLIPGEIDVQQPQPVHDKSKVATLNELVLSAQKDLLNEVVPKVEGKAKFVSRVAISNLSIALREIEFGTARDQAEIKSTNALLQKYLETDLETVASCRKKLCEIIQENKSDLEEEKLKAHFRNCIVRKISIDQPTYSGLQRAMGKSSNKV